MLPKQTAPATHHLFIPVASKTYEAMSGPRCIPGYWRKMGACCYKVRTKDMQKAQWNITYFVTEQQRKLIEQDILGNGNKEGGIKFHTHSYRGTIDDALKAKRIELLAKQPKVKICIADYRYSELLLDWDRLNNIFDSNLYAIAKLYGPNCGPLDPSGGVSIFWI
jgi:hypothetical protein